MTAPDTSNISNGVFDVLQALADFKAGDINAQQVTNIVAAYIQQEKSALLEEVLTMNGWHEGDWKESIKAKLKDLNQGEKECGKLIKE